MNGCGLPLPEVRPVERGIEKFAAVQSATSASIQSYRGLVQRPLEYDGQHWLSNKSYWIARTDRALGRFVEMRTEENASKLLTRMHLARRLYPATEFTRAYQEEVNRLAVTASSRRANRERQLKAVERKIQAIMDAVEKGLYSPSMNDRMRQLEAERQALRRAQETVEAPSPVMVHPLTSPSSTAAALRTWSSSCSIRSLAAKRWT